MIIAVDGPAASGKGTLARRLAAEYGLAHLDTGLLYRAISKRVLDTGEDPSDEAAAVAAARALDLGDIESNGLRSEAIGEAASQVASIPAVRAELVKLQQEFASRPGGAVLDGRDTCTVICPEADVKLFVTASVEERARRRHAELVEQGEVISLEAVTADVQRRDDRDRNRSASPLQQAPGAYLLDTSNLSIDSAFAKAKAFISKHLG
tara:strand:- start:905 stop:1528 length:624 start_codon:yes stop_codon:yes gene_type:complete